MHSGNCFRPATPSSVIGATSGDFVLIYKAKSNLRYLQKEIKEDFKKGANKTKRFCRNSLKINSFNSFALKLSTALQVEQRFVAKSLKFEQFPTTSTYFNADNNQKVGKILGGSTWLSAQETTSTKEVLFFSPLIYLCHLPFIWHLRRSQEP